MDEAPERPDGVPEEAWWVEEDGEWELGELNDDGDKHGLFRYWRADGTLCNECHFVDGVPHGPFKRFHENGEISQEGEFQEGQLHGVRTFLRTDGTTTESMPEGLAEAVWRAEMEFERGRVVGGKLFDRDGAQVLPDGSPFPARPDGVPEEAQYSVERAQWYTGEFDENQERTGTWRSWNRDGHLVEEAQYQEGAFQGVVKEFRSPGQVRAVTEYNAGSKQGKYQGIVDKGTHADPQIQIEKGEFDRDFAVGVWGFFDGKGQLISKVDFGVACPDDEEVLGSPAFANEAHTPQHWSEVSRDLIRQRRMGEAICAFARAASEEESPGGLENLLERATVQLSEEAARQAADAVLSDAGQSPAVLCNALVRGADAAAILQGLAILLDQKLLSRAALDLINAALLLAPDRLGFFFTRSLVNMSLGNDLAAVDDAKSLEPKDPDQAKFLKNYARVLFPVFDFWPGREKPETHYTGLPDSPAQELESIRLAIRKYAVRLTQIREALNDLVPGQPDWMPPDLTGLLVGAPVELRAWQFEIPDPDDPDDPYVVDVDERLDIEGWELPALLRAARGDWCAVTWLCWAVGLDHVTLPDSISPPGEFGLAAGMAASRLWRCRDLRVTGGQAAAAQEIPGFAWERMEIETISPHLALIAENQYAEMQAMFYWLTNPDNQSPWQDNLRGS